MANGVVGASIGPELFPYQNQVAIQERQEELTERHNAYLKSHVELQQVLHEFLQALVIHKPDAPLQYMHDYFTAHREKHAKYVPP